MVEFGEFPWLRLYLFQFNHIMRVFFVKTVHSLDVQRRYLKIRKVAMKHQLLILRNISDEIENI